MSFFEYAASLRRMLAGILQSGLAVAADLEERPKSATLGYVRISLRFVDGSELQAREYVDTSLSEPRLMYAYHYHDAKQQMVFRYDNAAHRPAPAKAEHKHIRDGLELAPPPTFEQLLKEIVALLPKP